MEVKKRHVTSTTSLEQRRSTLKFRSDTNAAELHIIESVQVFLNVVTAARSAFGWSTCHVMTGPCLCRDGPSSASLQISPPLVHLVGPAQRSPALGPGPGLKLAYLHCRCVA